MKASPQIQLRLLELADLDAELARLDHRRRGLPEVAALAARQTRAGELKDALVATETELGDLSREQTRAERDVEQDIYALALERFRDALHLVRERLPDVPVLFLETGYHFDEVYRYRDEMTARYGLNTGDVNTVVQAAMGGAVASQVLEGDRFFNLTVRLAPQYRNSIEAIHGIANSM